MRLHVKHTANTGAHLQILIEHGNFLRRLPGGARSAIQTGLREANRFLDFSLYSTIRLSFDKLLHSLEHVRA